MSTRAYTGKTNSALSASSLSVEDGSGVFIALLVKEREEGWDRVGEPMRGRMGS